MTHFDLPNWVAPAILVLIGGGTSLVKMAAKIALTDQGQDDQGKDIAELKKRVDGHDTRIGAIESTLARIEAGVEYIKEAVGKS